MMLAAALTLCSCGGVLGFVSPSVAVGRVSAAAAGERTGQRRKQSGWFTCAYSRVLQNISYSNSK